MCIPHDDESVRTYKISLLIALYSAREYYSRPITCYDFHDPSFQKPLYDLYDICNKCANIRTFLNGSGDKNYRCSVMAKDKKFPRFLPATAVN